MAEAQDLMEKLHKRSILEVQFQSEEGTGLGPTLEFFNLLADELKRAKDANGISIWK